MDYFLRLTGNEARLIFFAIKNKKSEQAKTLRQKLVSASQERDSFMKSQKMAQAVARTN